MLLFCSGSYESWYEPQRHAAAALIQIKALLHDWYAPGKNRHTRCSDFLIKNANNSSFTALTRRLGCLWLYPQAVGVLIKRCRMDINFYDVSREGGTYWQRVFHNSAWYDDKRCKICISWRKYQPWLLLWWHLCNGMPKNTPWKYRINTLSLLNFCRSLQKHVGLHCIT